MLKKNIYLYILSLILLLPVLSLWSQTDIEEEADEIVVTADRIEQKSKELTDAHTIITRKEIEESGSQTVDEILRNQAGVDIRTNGGRGRRTTVFIRGTNGDSGALILIDGVNVNDVNTNSYPDLQNLQLNDVERIEIIRGSQVSLYGFSAAGGVINIITRKGKGKKTTLLSHGQGGSHDSVQFGAGMFGSEKNYNFFFMGNYFTTDGYIKPRDGANSKNFTFSGTFRPSKLSKLSLVAKYTDSMVQLYRTGGLPESDDFRQNLTSSIVGLTYQRLIEGVYEPIIRLNYKSFTLHATSSFGPSVRVTDAFNGSIQNNFYIAGGKDILSIGFEYGNEEYKTSFTGATGFGISRYNLSAYISNLFRVIPKLFINTSARIDYWQSTYQWKDTFYSVKGGIAYHIVNKKGKGNIVSLVKVRGNVSKVKIATSFLDISGLTDPSTLNPEEYFTFDLGIDTYFFDDKLKLSATYFHTFVENFIFFDFLAPGPFGFGVTKNGGNAKYDGIELEAKTRLPLGFTAKASYTYTKLNIDASDQRQLGTRRPEHKALAYLNWNYHKPLNININWLYTGKRRDFDSTITGKPFVELPEFHVVNVAASYTFFKMLTLYGKLNNLYDKIYEDPKGFTQDGFNWFAGIRLRIPLD